jgi:hypothetical protein
MAQEGRGYFLIIFSRPHHLVIFRRRFNAKKEENPINKSLKFPANMSFRNDIEDGIPGIAKKSAVSNNRGASLRVTSML